MSGYRCITCDGTGRWLIDVEAGDVLGNDMGPCPEGCPEPSRRPPRWLSYVDWAEMHDLDLPNLSTKGYALGIWTPVLDNRDAIVGGRWTPAPPDQQYGERCQRWLSLNRNRSRVALHLGCTGHVDRFGFLDHDGETCPIHEAISPEEPF